MIIVRCDNCGASVVMSRSREPGRVTEIEGWKIWNAWMPPDSTAEDLCPSCRYKPDPIFDFDPAEVSVG